MAGVWVSLCWKQPLKSFGWCRQFHLIIYYDFLKKNELFQKTLHSSQTYLRVRLIHGNWSTSRKTTVRYRPLLLSAYRQLGHSMASPKSEFWPTSSFFPYRYTSSCHTLFILQPNNFESLCECYSLSCVQLFVPPWPVAHQIPLSMGFPRQEYWSGLPFLSPGDLPNPGIEPSLLHCEQILYHLSHKGSHQIFTLSYNGCLIWICLDDLNLNIKPLNTLILSTHYVSCTVLGAAQRAMKKHRPKVLR